MSNNTRPQPVNNDNNNSKAQAQRPPIRRGGGPGALIPGEKARDFKGSMRQLIRYLGKYRWLILFTMLLAAGSTVFSIFGPRTLGQATTELYLGVQRMVQNDPRGIDFVRLNQIFVKVLILYLISTLLGVIQGYVLTTISAKITYQLRKEISEKLNRLPISFFDKVTHGEVLSRVTNDVDTINQTLNQSLSQIITSLTRVVGVLIMMLSINWLMTLIGVAMVPLAMIFIRFVVSKSQVYYRRQQEYLGHINGHVEEMYGGHVVLKAFNGEKASIARFEELNDTLYDSAWRSQFLTAVVMPSMRLISNFGYIAVAMLGGSLVIQGKLNVGDIQAFISYLRSFQDPLLQIANITNILQQTAAAAERVFEFLHEPEVVPETENPVYLDQVKGAVEFKNVRFGYDPENPVIKDFSVKVEPGQQIAIVGPTGAGKTTLVKLLMRYYDIDSGKILVDGVNIKDFSRNDLRSKFAMVLQDTWLFNGTIRENIRYGRQEATDEEVEQAADMAYADHFTRTLPGGYEMVLNEEASNVSAGQKQLLTIARAVLANPSILILDEATSSVDTRTEILIQKAMDKLMKGRTSFVIAHRLSTIRNADRILVLKDGDIVEQGTHESLLEDNGFYAELYNSQFATQVV